MCDHSLSRGEYCDIISECEQMISVSGGRGHFKPHDGQEPVVAICVGCGKSAPPTTQRPTTTDKTTQTTAEPDTTTAKTTTTPATTAVGHCCDTIVLTSSGGVADNYPELLGIYVDTGSEENGRPVFR